MFKRSKISFRTIIVIFSVLMTAVIIISSGTVMLLNARNELWDKEKNIHNNIASSAFNNINRHFNQIYNIATYFEGNKVLKENLNIFNEVEKEKDFIPFDIIEKRDFVIEILESTKEQNTYLMFLYDVKMNIEIVEDIIIITPEGTQISDDEGIYLSDEDIEINKLSIPYSGANMGKTLFNIPEKDSDATNSFLYEFSGKWSITFDLYLDTVFLGKVLIILPDNLLSTLTKEQPVLLYNHLNEEIIYETELFDDKSMMIMKENEDVIRNGLVYVDGDRALYKENLSPLGWDMYYAVNREQYNNHSKDLQLFVLLFSILSLIISLFSSGYFSKKMLKKINLLNAVLKEYRYKKNEQIKITESNKPKSKISFKQRIFIYFLVTTMIPVLFFILTFSVRTINLNNQYIKEQAQALTITAANNLTEAMEKNLELFFSLAQDILVQDKIKIDDYTYYEENNIWDYYDESSETILDDIMEQKMHMGLSNSRFRIYDPNGDIKLSNSFVSSKVKKVTEEYFADALKYDARMRWFFTRDELGKEVLRLKIKLFSIKYSDMLGYGVLDIDYNYILNLFSETSAGDYLVNIIDSNGYMEFSLDDKANFMRLEIPDQDKGVIEFEKNNIDYITYFKRIDTQTGGENPAWYMTYSMEASDLFRNSASVIYGNMSMFILIILFIISISLLLSSIILRPFGRITKAFKEIDIENLNTINLKHNYIDEIEEVEESFNGMVIRLEELIDELLISNSQKSQLETRKKAAEITALQAQISPHFLYNTLNTIIHLVNEQENENAITMIKSLSELFRYSINSKKDEISIKEEIDYAKSYTNIMMFRFDRKVEFVWDISEEVLEMRTTKLLLQPIIENALNHGYRSGKKLEIHITCKKVDNEVEFEIADNGSGMSARELKIIKERLDAPKNLGSSIGMYNVNSRAKLKYGSNYGLTINSIQDTGTFVKITIPVVYSDNAIGEVDGKA